MPKDKRSDSASRDRSEACPYQCDSWTTKASSRKNFQEREAIMKEWEEVRCSVCMDYPHNAILLICSSHEKGCLPFMCDTSYRHSNCFDQYCKSFKAASSIAQEESATENFDSTVSSESQSNEMFLDAPQSSTPFVLSSNSSEPKLVCPLCRGQIMDWKVIEPARRFFNEKLRSCASETCEFSGTYRELRKHARSEHPTARPSEADPRREQSWRRLEWQRDMGDLLSTIQSSIDDDKDDEQLLPIDDGGWLTFFLLIRVFRPATSGRSRSSRARTQLSFGRRLTRLWGENHNGEPESPAGEEGSDSSDGRSIREAPQ